MDIKLKKWIKNRYLKLAAYLIIAVCIGISAYCISSSKNEDIQQQALYYKHYDDSEQFTEDLDNFMRSVVYAKLFYEDGDKIKSKQTISEEEIEARKRTVFNNVQVKFYGAMTEGENDTDNENLNQDRLTFDQYFYNYPQKEKEIVNSIIKEQILDLKNYEREIEKNKIFTYRVTEDEDEVELLKNKYEKYPFFLFITKDDINSNKDYIRHGLINSAADMGKLNQNKSLFVGIEQSRYNGLEIQWNLSRQELTDIAKPVIIILAIALLAMIYLAAVTGRGGEKNKLYLYPLDAVYSEIQIIVFIMAMSVCVGLISLILDSSLYSDIEANESIFCGGFTAAMTAAVMTALCMFLSQARKIKAKNYSNSFITVRLFKKAYRIIRQVWRNEKISRKAIALSIILPLLCTTWIGTPFVIAFLIFIINKYITNFTEVCEGTKIIRNGDLNYQINIPKESELSQLADDINQISQGLEKAVSNEIRSERLKAELISNVSHDLKTPLTSIVTYVDLLKQEEISNATAADYIGVIERKAKQLTALTNDLFEAAKASSGAMPVEIEKIDWNAIIRQGLGEFDEKLQSASLEMKVKLLEEPAYITADGRLLWRVLDNLLGNVVKYALEKSRVYISLEEEDLKIHFTIKNISAYELNIPAEELMERFKRGDESRNSEGSGLGLSIANSLIDLQKGIFKISIDGDLFRVDIWMPKWISQVHDKDSLL